MALEKRVQIVLDFADARIADHFVGWFLDGGGEYDFNESLRHDEGYCEVDWPADEDEPIRRFSFDWPEEEE